jgi:6-phosphogluconolactonase
LFPGTSALAVSDRSVLANWVPKLNAHRVTFTYPLIEAARHICFLVADSAKNEVVEEVIAGDPRHPASRVAACPQAAWFLGY